MMWVEKPCSVCSRLLPRAAYYVRPGRPLGVQSACKSCVCREKRWRYHRDPVATLEYLRECRARRFRREQSKQSARVEHVAATGEMVEG
jgi:hypothetical protein